MSEHVAMVSWRRGDAPFVDNRYSRAHVWGFDGGATVPGSSAPASVPVPLSDPSAVDPEEAFVAALSACHMLWFLALAAKRGLVVDSYDDEATGILARDGFGRTSITTVVLRPRIAFSGDRQPSSDELSRLHHDAHERCYIANSVRSEVTIEPR